MPHRIEDYLTLKQKLNLAILSFSWGTPVLFFFEKYIFNDWSFLVSIFLLVTLDSFSGGIANAIQGNFSTRILYRKLSIKIFALTVTIVCIGILKNAIIGGSNNLMHTWVDASVYAIMLGFEGTSVLKNCYKIYPWEPIKIILTKLEVYYKKKVDEKES